jgi:catechol-2,3-dioxygenase
VPGHVCPRWRRWGRWDYDPDFNGLELAWDRDPSQWLRRDGALRCSREPLNFASLLAELGEPDRAGYVAVLSAYR